MRKYSADFILTPTGKLVRNHFLVIDDHGKVIDLVQGETNESIHHAGILSPGFINTHCHLELSYLIHKIPGGTGLHGFISNLVKTRNADTSGIVASIEQADQHMWENGIQAVGDICNTGHTFSTKHNSRIRYHSFIELFNFNPSESIPAFKGGELLLKDAITSHRHASIIPHAPYSVTRELFNLIADHHRMHPAPWTIHNQESSAENDLFTKGAGHLRELFMGMGISMDGFTPTGKNSLPSVSQFFPDNSPLLLVHNTFTSGQDVDDLKLTPYFQHTWWCLCAKANLYIEKQLPDVKMLFDAGCQLTIGTDSLASNDTLSVLEEIKTIHSAFPGIPVENLLSWATRNGAGYFGWEDLGAFTKNAAPGVVLISNADENKIQPESRVQRIL